MGLDLLLSLWDKVSDGMKTVYGIMTSTLRDLLSVDIPVVQTVINFIIDNLGIGDWTVIDIMFGIGIPFIVIFAITKWLLDIVL